MAIKPNAFHLSHKTITVSYFPDGTGPMEERGRLMLTYQDAHHSLQFRSADVRVAEVPDLGTVVSVTLIGSVDTGSTTFSVLMPTVELADDGRTVPVHARGVTTVHRVFAGALGHPQHETYSDVALTGTAVNAKLPDLAPTAAGG